MRIIVHVREKCVPVSVGVGSQPVRWLAHVGIARHDEQQGRNLGAPIGMKAEDGSLLNMNSSLLDSGVKDMQHLWVVLKGEGRSPRLPQTICAATCAPLTVYRRPRSQVTLTTTSSSRPRGSPAPARSPRQRRRKPASASERATAVSLVRAWAVGGSHASRSRAVFDWIVDRVFW